MNLSKYFTQSVKKFHVQDICYLDCIQAHREVVCGNIFMIFDFGIPSGNFPPPSQISSIFESLKTPMTFELPVSHLSNEPNDMTVNVD